MIAPATEPTGSAGWLQPEELAKLSSLELRARGVVEGFMQGLHRSPFVGYSVEFSSHRRYGPGDDLRHVNWKLFARSRKLYVKEFDAETNLNLYIFVDSSRSMQCKLGGALTKFDYAATLAAALASLAIKQRDAVALGLMNDGISAFLEASANPGRWDDCVQLLSHPAHSQITSLSKALEGAAALARHRGIVAIFSDLVDKTDGIARGLQQLKHRGHEVVVFHLLDPWERRLPQEGRIRFADLESPAEITTDVESIRVAYGKRVDAWCAELRDICLNLSVDRLELTTDISPTQALVDYLVRRSSN
ncbi:MAG: DUF58 domain-containing protein [Pirellulaceae bacterium]|nr:DUF58 domain-containing protein [Pirellulaceae bacterium]